MLTNTRIFTRLAALSAFLLAFVVAITVEGINGMSHMRAGLKTVYEDRAIPLGQLSDIRGKYYEIRLAVVNATGSNDVLTVRQRQSDIDAVRKDIDKTWDSYAATFLTPDEKRLVADAVDAIDAYDDARTRVLSAAAANDFQGARALAADIGGKRFSDLMKSLEDLTQLQIDVARQEYVNANNEFDFDRNLAIAGLIAALLLGSGLAFVIARSVSGPLAGAIGRMDTMAKGDYDAPVEGRDRGDEIGAVARALETFRAKLSEAARLRTDQTAAAAKLAAERKQALHQMASNFESSVGGIIRTVAAAAAELQASSETLAASAEQTLSQVSAVAASSSQVSSNVQTVAAAAEELSASIQEISRQVAQSTEMTGNAVSEAETSNGKVTEMSAAARRINDVVELINSIASQTNLLALNATIEAARAGEAGKGFAVVASEVKNLATQTGKATDDIASQVNGMQQATNHAVDAIQRIAKTIEALSAVSTTIAAAVEQQSAATKEISRSVQQASMGSNEVSGKVENVNEAARSTGTAASEVLSAARELSQQAEILNTEVGKFLDTVRAG